MEKQEILSNLYTLRAGLSVISQQDDKVEALAEETRSSIAQLCGQSPERQTTDYIFSDESITDAQNKIANRKASYKRSKRTVAISSLFAVIFAIVGIVGLVLAISAIKGCSDASTYGDADPFIFRTYIYIPIALVGIGGFCWLAFFHIPDSRDRGYKLELEPYERYLVNVNNIRQSIVDCKEQQKQETKPIKQNCEKIYAALQQQFSSFLDVRDWKHLDLVIYYFETRRADTVKEALQLVDREMQTQMLVKTIKQATRQICNTIRDGFATLNDNITNCFTALSDQMASQHAQSMAAIQGLTNSVNLNNALKAKSNRTSEQLMNDVKHIRNYVCR